MSGFFFPFADEDDEEETPVRTFSSEGAAGERLLIGRGETRDDLQANGAWIETDDPADLNEWQ